MKRTVALIIALMLMLVQFGAFAEMGVQIIGGPETESEPVSLDDIKLNTDIEIPGYASLNPTSFAYQDGLGAYNAGAHEPGAYSSGHYSYYWSGKEAEYAILSIDILNTTTTSKEYLANCEVKVVYDDVYEYGGWFYQRNYNNSSSEYYFDMDADKNSQNLNWVINPADQFSIDPMYQGHYVFGCTLPNAVVSSKSPLKMVITIDGNEITYNIRK